MADIFKTVGTGRLTRDAELKYTSGGMAISNFAIAVNRRVKEGDRWTEKASFFDCKLFGKTAESVSKYLTKGKQVAIEGRIDIESWESEKDGQRHSKPVITLDNVQLLGGQGDRPAHQAYEGASAFGGQKYDGSQPYQRPDEPAYTGTFQEDEIENIPF